MPFLAELLSSSDEQVRLLGVRGMSLFVEGAPVITPERALSMEWLRPTNKAPYRTADTDAFSGSRGVPADSSTRYVEFWKNWWNTTREKLGN